MDKPFPCAFFISLKSPLAFIYAISIPRKGGIHMEYVAERTIDELGRIIVPAEARQPQGWGKGTKIAVYIHNDTVILKKSTQPQEEDE